MLNDSYSYPATSSISQALIVPATPMMQAVITRMMERVATPLMRRGMLRMLRSQALLLAHTSMMQITSAPAKPQAR